MLKPAVKWLLYAAHNPIIRCHKLITTDCRWGYYGSWVYKSSWRWRHVYVSHTSSGGQTFLGLYYLRPNYCRWIVNIITVRFHRRTTTNAHWKVSLRLLHSARNSRPRKCISHGNRPGLKVKPLFFRRYVSSFPVVCIRCGNRKGFWWQKPMRGPPRYRFQWAKSI